MFTTIERVWSWYVATTVLPLCGKDSYVAATVWLQKKDVRGKGGKEAKK